MKYRVKHVCLAVLIGVGFTQAALAAPDAAMLAEAKSGLQNVFAKGGMEELSRHIIHCYDKATETLTQQSHNAQDSFNAVPGNQALKVCLLEDVVAINLERKRLKAAMQNGQKDPAPSSLYYTPPYYRARLALYAAALFPTYEKAHNFLANNPFPLVIEGMKNSPGDISQTPHK